MKDAKKINCFGRFLMVNYLVAIIFQLKIFRATHGNNK